MTQYVFDIETEEGVEELRKLAEAFGMVGKEAGESGEKAKKTEEELDKLGKTGGRASDLMEKLGKIGLASLGFGAIVAGAQKLGAAITGVKDKVIELSAAGDEQRAINDQLSASVLTATGSVAEAEKAWGGLQSLIAEGAANTNFGDEEIAQGLTRFIDLTGDASVSSKDLNTLLGMSARRGEDLTASAEKLSKARKGDVEALKELTPLNKEQVAALAAIQDPAERGAKAMAILSSQYEGAANTTGTASGALKNNADAIGDTLQAMGMLVNQSGALQAIYEPMTGAIREAETWLKSNAGAVQGLALTVAGKLVTALRFGVEVMSTVAQGAVYIGAGFDTAKFGMEVFLRGMVIVGAGISSFVTDVLAKAVDKLGEFGEDAADLADAVGADGLAKKLREGSQGLSGFSDSLDGMSTAALEQVDAQMGAINDSGRELKEDLAESQKNLRKVQDVASKVDGVLGQMAGNIEYAKHNVSDTVKEFNKEAKAVSDIKDDTKDIKDTQAASSKESAAMLDKRRALLAIESLILDAQVSGNKESEAGLQYQKAMLQAQLDRLKSGDDALALERQQLAEKRAQIQKDRELAAIAMQREDAAREAHAQRMNEIAEQRDAERAAEEERIANVREMGGLLAASLAGYSGTAGSALGALGEVGDGIFEMTARYDELRLAGESANMALAGSAAGLAGTLGAVAAQNIKDTKKQAAVRGAFAAAEAALLYAIGNIPGGIAATAASVGHFAVAGTSGGSAPSTGGAPASQGVSRDTGVSSQAADEQARRTGRYIAEAINGTGGQAGGISISFDLSGSTNLESSPTIARRLTQTMRRELEREGITLNRRGR